MSPSGNCVLAAQPDYSPDYSRKAGWESWGRKPPAGAFELHPVCSGASAVYSERYTRPPGFAQLNQLGFESEAAFFSKTGKSNCLARESLLLLGVKIKERLWSYDVLFSEPTLD